MEERILRKTKKSGVLAPATRRQDYNQARGEVERAIFKAKMMRGRGFTRTWGGRIRRAVCLE